LVYKVPQGSTSPGGGGGTYYLYSGSENRARFPIDENTRLVVHTHPGGQAGPSPQDIDLLIRLNGPEFNSPQKSAQIIAVGDSSFQAVRYNVNSTAFK
jgi:proteasome lid subunit RPN8/RPN11